MNKIKNVKMQAVETKITLKSYFASLSPEEVQMFKSHFHLRPTSSSGTTIVSHWKHAPMWGIVKIPDSKLLSTLIELGGILTTQNDSEKRIKMENIGFCKQKTDNPDNEINAQAAFIRDLYMNPNKYDGMCFIASEFVLFDYEGVAGATRFVDVLTYKDEVLYVIEVKKRETKVVYQADGYVKDISGNLAEYALCLNDFPNSDIGNITTVQGISLVPSVNDSSGKIEKACSELGIGLWTYNRDAAITTESTDDFYIKFKT
jgi:hypothetical protein